MNARLARSLPPALVFGVLLVLMALVAHRFPLPALPLASSISSALSLGLGLAGALVALAGIVQFRRARTTVDPRSPDRASQLVTDGIYRFTRNPMYLGFALVLVGWAVKLDQALALIGPLIFVLWIDRVQISFEERAMRARFGEAFDRYCRRTRRWI